MSWWHVIVPLTIGGAFILFLLLSRHLFEHKVGEWQELFEDVKTCFKNEYTFVFSHNGEVVKISASSEEEALEQMDEEQRENYLAFKRDMKKWRHDMDDWSTGMRRWARGMRESRPRAPRYRRRPK